MGAPSPSPDESGIVAIGSVLDGRYKVNAVLGVGGMGRVYKAEHTGIGRAVAIKVLHARLGGSKEAAQRMTERITDAYRLGDEPVAPLPIVYARVTDQGIEEVAPK